MSGKPFFLTRRTALHALDKWLQGRRYNCGGHAGATDRNGNPIISLGWDYDPDNDFKLPEKRGLIIVTDASLVKDADELVQKRMAKS